MCFAFDLLQVAPEDEKAMEFAGYVLKMYVDETANFPSAIWADLNTRRTTNGCESFHKQLSTLFYHSHPNIFDFMDNLKCIQTYSYSKIRASQSESLSEKRE